jgi:hypothetical protein
MTRSATALKARAIKRNRTIETQRRLDALASFGKQKEKAAKQMKASNITIGSALQLQFSESLVVKGRVIEIQKINSPSGEEKVKYNIELDEDMTFSDGQTKRKMWTSLKGVNYSILKTDGIDKNLMVLEKKNVVIPSDWVCDQCSNRNFASRLNCNRCMAPHQNREIVCINSLDTQSLPNKNNVQNPKSVRDLCSNSSLVLSEKDSSNVKPSKWQPQADNATIERNKWLREMYETNKDALSADDITRAEILIQRSARKKSKILIKMKRKIKRK